MRGAAILIACSVLSMTSCYASVGQYASYAGTPDDNEKVWSLLEDGARVALFDPTRSCNATLADDSGSLDKGQRLGDTEWGSKVSVWTIDATSVRTKSATGDVILMLHDDAGVHKVLRYGMAQPNGCIWESSPAIDAALKLVGKKLGFAPAGSAPTPGALAYSPWVAGCSQNRGGWTGCRCDLHRWRCERGPNARRGRGRLPLRPRASQLGPAACETGGRE